VPGDGIVTPQERDTTELELDMLRSDDLLEGHLDYEAWMDSLGSMCGRYNPKGVERNTFAGWLRPVGIGGLAALDDLGSNAHQIERRIGMFASMAEITMLRQFKSPAGQGARRVRAPARRQPNSARWCGRWCVMSSRRRAATALGLLADTAVEPNLKGSRWLSQICEPKRGKP
jgi:hypothetical protein